MKETVLLKIQENIGKVMIGNEQTTKLILTALAAGGHVLLEDVPGTGKTVLAKSLAKSMEGVFGRVQFTPDLLPSDVTGLNYFDHKTGEFRFQEGPVFCNILLADEINRATPKTQSSLLECMAEQQVTVDGQTRTIQAPFFVIATQNPLETLGTYPLPEAQLDRFMMQISMESLTKEQEIRFMKRFMEREPLKELEAVCTREDICQLQQACKEVYIQEELLAYLVEICQQTRIHKRISCGVSPRASLSFLNAAKGYALVSGRAYVVPEDIKAVAVSTLSHRMILDGGFDGKKESQTILLEILEKVPLPTERWER